jgi:acyl-CoA synthetase (NDP forming)
VLNGKQVVVYKSGRTAPGQGGVMGHTASIAGDLTLFESVVRHAGAIVAEDFKVFDDLFYIAGALHGKKIGGGPPRRHQRRRLRGGRHGRQHRVGQLRWRWARWSADTVKPSRRSSSPRSSTQLVEVRNPIDINPGADDEAHLQITEAFLQDPNIDAVVVGLDPTAPSVRALVESKLRPGYDLSDPKSTVHLMPPLVERNDKP